MFFDDLVRVSILPYMKFFEFISLSVGDINISLSIRDINISCTVHIIVKLLVALSVVSIIELSDTDIVCYALAAVAVPLHVLFSIKFAELRVLLTLKSIKTTHFSIL